MSERSGELGWELDAQQRARRADTRDRWRRAAIAGASVLALLAIAAGSAWAFWLRDDPPTHRAGGLPPDVTLGQRPAFDTGPPCRDPLTTDDPLRLWIGGDSLAGSLGPALGEQTAETGIVEPTFDYHTSSGLTSPSFFDWPERARDEMQRVDPELVVFIIGANDTGIARDDAEDAPWRELYEELVDEMLDIFTGDGRSVYWVGSPPLRDERKNQGAKLVNEVAAATVAQRSDATYIDAYDLFADDGEYTATRRNVAGDEVRVRTSDGVHFTRAGGELLATYVFAYMDEQCELADQAVFGEEQPVRQAPGSGEAPLGDADGDGDVSGTSPETVGTTSTTPAPPTTAPPTTIISIPLVGP